MEAMLAELGAPPGIREEVAANVPRYLVPVPSPDQSEAVRHLAKAGFATVVALPLNSAEAVELARRQVLSLASMDAPVLLFLERIAAIDIEVSVAGADPMPCRLTREVEQVPVPSAARLKNMRMERVTLDKNGSFLVVKLYAAQARRAQRRTVEPLDCAAPEALALVEG